MTYRSIPLVLLALPLFACSNSEGLGDAGGAGGLGSGETSGGAPGWSVSGSTGAAGEADAATEEGQGGGGQPVGIQGCDALPGTVVDISLHGHPSMAAAQYARAALLSEAHVVPDTETVRSEDFLAFYGLSRADVPSMTPASLRWFPVGKEEPGNLGATLELDYVSHPNEREPLRFVILLDVSPSLSQSIDLETSVLTSLARGITADAVPGDSLAVMTFAGDVVTEADAPIDPAAGPYGGLPVDSIVLTSRGGNDFGKAMTSALAAAQVNGTIGHVLLVSDGGTTLREELLQEIRVAASNGTRVSAAQVGIALPTGPAPIDTDFLDQIAGAGRGATFYVGEPIDAARAFERRFGASFGVFARGVVAHIELPPFLEAVGLPEPGIDQNGGPAGGILGSNTVTPLRIGMRAACADILIANDLDIRPFKVSIASQAGELVPPTEFGFLATRSADPISKRNDAILAAALAIRSKDPVDIQAAHELIGIVSNADPCLGCEDLAELKTMLDFVK